MFDACLLICLPGGVLTSLLSQTLVPGAILKGWQDTTRARKIPENKCEGFLHGSLSRVGMIRRVIHVPQITLPIHPDNHHPTCHGGDHSK